MGKGNLTTAEVSFWLKEAESCIERQLRELIQRNNYPFLVYYYEGIEKVDALHPHVSAEQQMSIINEYFPSTNSLISELIYQHPDILLDATKPEAEEDTPLMKAGLIYYFDKSDSLTENRVALFDMLYAGYSAIEVDILPIVDRAEQEDSIEQQIQDPDQPKSVFDQFKRGVQKALNSEDAEKNLAKLSPPMETNFATVQGTYTRRYNPLNVPLDWRAERIKDRRYNLKKVWLSKAEFDVKYPKFKDMVNVEENNFEHSKHTSSLHNRKVLLYEFQVRLRGGQYQTIIVSPTVKTQEIDSFIRPYTTNGFNMKIGSLHKYGKLYPKSLAQINKKMQDEMNRYVKHQMEVAERNIPKYLSDKNKVKSDAKAALTSTNVNAVVEVDGNTTGAVTPLQPTISSFENKELMSIFQDQKNKLWSVSEARISGRSQAEFATDLAIQEAGFETRNVDIQEGLRMSIEEQLDTAKDIIAKFWDDATFLKVTGSKKMKWYEPVLIPDPNNSGKQIVQNPLSDILTGDYNVKIDIASAKRKNRQDELNAMFFFMTQLVNMRPILIEQGKDINLNEIRKVSKEFGWNPDELFIDHQPAQAPTVPTATGESISPEEDARRQAEAEGRAGEQANVV